jgi:hypothetical protein
MEVRMASLKCSKSDLAVVVHDHYEKNNLGLIVRIERYAGTRPIVGEPQSVTQSAEQEDAKNL